MTAAFKINPLFLLMRAKVMPAGNEIVGWRLAPCGSLEIFYDGVDAPLPVLGEDEARTRLVIIALANGEEQRFLEAVTPSEAVILEGDEAIRAALYDDHPDPVD